MANLFVDTGHGASIVFSTSGYAFNWLSMDFGEEAIPDIDRTHLGTTDFREYIPGDLKTPGEVTIPFQWDSGAAQILTGVVQTITGTLPLSPAGLGFGAAAQTVASTIAGTGYIKRIKRPNFATDELATGELTVMFNGITGPTTTAGS